MHCALPWWERCGGGASWCPTGGSEACQGEARARQPRAHRRVRGPVVAVMWLGLLLLSGWVAPGVVASGPTAERCFGGDGEVAALSAAAVAFPDAAPSREYHSAVPFSQWDAGAGAMVLLVRHLRCDKKKKYKQDSLRDDK
jgi:hypothetical protein